MGIVKARKSVIGSNTPGDTIVPSETDITVEGNLNYRRLNDRSRYNRWLLGTATTEELGHNSTQPSWTNANVGRNDAFVITELKSEQHEITNLNAYSNGITILEQTEVPASINEYYSKKVERTTKIYAVTASVELSGTSGGAIGEYSSVSGNLMSGSFVHPVSIEIDIPDYGKITNIRVWIEVVSSNDYVGDDGTLASLSLLHISMKSPNVQGFTSYPFISHFGNKVDLVAKNPEFGSQTVFDSFILMDNYLITGNPLTAEDMPPWGRDRSIRTIFDDSSVQRNMHHLDPLYASGSTTSEFYLCRAGSPDYFFSSSVILQPQTGGVGQAFTGNGTPWTSESRIVSNVGYALGGSPPEGWNVDGINEFPTFGRSYGPNTIRPMYPLLDPVIEKLPLRTQNFPAGIVAVGTRPGLRGSEIHGKWTINFVTNAQTEPTGQFFISNFFFRQARIELTYEKNRGPNIQPGRSRTFSPVNPNHKASTFMSTSCDEFSYGSSEWGLELNVGQLSGSQSVAEHWSPTTDTPGRTYGITSDTGSLDYAVFIRPTGSLESLFTSSLGFHNDFLNNEFGTPYIPLSSGSSDSDDIEATLEENKQTINEVLNPKPIITKALTLKPTLSNFETTTTTRNLISKATNNLSGSS